MAVPSPPELVHPRFQETLQLHRCWVWFLVLGSALIVLGALAIGASFIATLATVVVFGSLLLAGGVVQIVNAVLARGWRAFLLHLFAGILQLLVGALMIEHPVRAAADLTLLLALAFLTGGVVRIIVCLFERFPGWPWVLLNGIVTALLGVAIWRQWPESSFWVIGTFVGIDLIFSGWSWVMLALAVKGAARATVPPVAG